MVPIRVFMITSEWPTPENPTLVPFIVRQVKFLRKAGIDVHLFPFRGGKDPKNYLKYWREVRGEISRGNFDIIHTQWGQSGLLALPKQLPLVVTFRGDDLEGIIGPNGKKTAYGYVLQTLSRFVARAADQVILVSESLSHALPKRNYHVIPSGLDLELFCPTAQDVARRKLGLLNNRRYVLFAGSASNPRKRYALAQQAVNLLKSELDVDILTASGIPHEQVPDYMNASDVMLLVSLHEGSPNVVKEALACNLPVVSTDVGDVRQRLSNIAGCMILENDQPEDIARALREVLLRNERVVSRPSVLDLDENVLTQKVIDVYRQALTSKQH